MNFGSRYRKYGAEPISIVINNTLSVCIDIRPLLLI